jgi:uracil-DNA glycosylase
MVEALAQAQIGETFNFYRRGPGAALRRARLAAYLELHADAPLLLVAEAPGFRGTRISGIPLTSERQLSGSGPAEATATIVHRVLAELELVQSVLLWNVVPTHPHLPGKPASNRRPTPTEVEASRPFLDTLARGRSVLAVGRLAESALGMPGIRHPSHGGAIAFRAGLMKYAGELGLGR